MSKSNGNASFIKKLDGCLESFELEHLNNSQPVRKGTIDLTTGLIVYEDGMREVADLKPENDFFRPTEFNTNYQ